MTQILKKPRQKGPSKIKSKSQEGDQLDPEHGSEFEGREYQGGEFFVPVTNQQQKYNKKELISLARKRTDFKPINSVLTGVLQQHGLENKLRQYEFVARWAEVVGESVARISRPESIRKEALIVRVTSAAWAQELSFHKQDMLLKLKKILPSDTPVNDLRFQVGDLAR